MGGAVSDEAKRKMAEKTYTTEETMNIILQTLLKEISTSDLVALSNPTVCSKYVLFMANDLYKHFSVLQFFPQHTSSTSSYIVFRKVDDLIKPPDTKMVEERQSLCLVLGYYYTRIFQIYGALALTLIDDINFMTKTGIVDVATIPQKTQQYLSAPLQPRNEQIAGFMKGVPIQGVPIQGVPMQGVPMQGVPMQGGATDSELESYDFLKSYIEKDSRNRYLTTWQKGYKLYYKGQDNERFNIYFSKESSDRTDRSDRSYGLFTIEDTDNNKEYYVQVYTKREGYTTMLTFRNVTTRRGSDSSALDIRLPSDKTIDLQNKIYSIAGKSVQTFFNKEFEYIIQSIFKIKTNAQTQGQAQGKAQPTIDELKLGAIISNLRDVRPLGHCIARAIQLLRTMPIPGKLSISHICKTKFFETSRGETRSGIPEPGESLRTSPGLYALAFLFYDTIRYVSPKLVIGTEQKVNGKTSYEQYIEFMLMMSIRFDDTDKDLRNPKTFDSGLKGIKNIRDSKICASNSEKDIYVPYKTATQLVTIINNMRDIQREHAAKCGLIFNMLFKINHDASGRPFAVLSDNLRKKGFDEIDSINHQARDLLIKYYSNCEYEYVRGLSLINETKQNPNAAQTAPINPVIPGSNVIQHMKSYPINPGYKSINNPDAIKTSYREQPSRYVPPAPVPVPVPAPAPPARRIARRTRRVSTAPAAPTTAPAPTTGLAPRPTGLAPRPTGLAPRPTGLAPRPTGPLRTDRYAVPAP